MSNYAIETQDLTRTFERKRYPPIASFPSEAPYQFLARLAMRSKQIQTVRAVDKVNIQVRQGEFLGIMGPNGSGKTTLMKLLGCLIYPTAGTAAIYGYDILDNRSKVLEHINFVPGLLTGGVWCSPGQTARRNLQDMAELFNLPKEKVDETLSLAGLEHVADVRVGTFSTGMLARLGVAFGLLRETPIYLMDEPTVGISPESVNDIQYYIRDHLNKKLGATVVYASHHVLEVQHMSDRVAIMDNGKIVACDSTGNLMREVRHLDVIELEVLGGPKELERHLQEMDGTVEAVSRLLDPIEGRLAVRISAKDSREVLPEIVGLIVKKFDARIVHVAVHEPTLEDVYIHYARRDLGEHTESQA